MLLTVTRLSLSHAGLPSQSVGVWGYPQPPEANVKWFSVASPGPAGNFSFFFIWYVVSLFDLRSIAHRPALKVEGKQEDRQGAGNGQSIELPAVRLSRAPAQDKHAHCGRRAPDQDSGACAAARCCWRSGCWSCAGADASRVARLQCLTQECDDEDELDEFEVFDIPAYEEVHPEEAVGASPLTPVHGRVKGLLKLPRSHENRRTEKRPLIWASGVRSSLRACRAHFAVWPLAFRWCVHLRRCASGCY